MSIHDMHPVDVKAALKKRFGSVAAFERSKNLPVGGVNDVLRGRQSQRVEDEIESVLMDNDDTDSVGSAHPKISVPAGADA